MTTLQYVEDALRDNWRSMIDGRNRPVGHLDEDIRIVEQSDDEWRAMSLENFDYITLMDGGDVDITPQSVGWTEQTTVSRVDIDIRTRGHANTGRPGKIALYGEREPSEGAPRWGGLVGEAHRCLKSVRKGDDEFTIIDVTAINDLTSEMGGQIWRSVLNARLEQRATVIDTEPEP